MSRDDSFKHIRRITAILTFLIAMALIAIGIYDYGRGTLPDRSQSVPVCSDNNCEKISSDAARSIMNIFYARYSVSSPINIHHSRWQGFDTTNLCELPASYLNKFKEDANLLKVNEAFSVFGIANIEKKAGNWTIVPGHGVDSFLDRIRKLVDVNYSGISCYRPYFRYYGILACIFLLITYLCFVSERRARKKRQST